MSRIEKWGSQPKKLQNYRKGLKDKQSYWGGEKFGFIINCGTVMVTLEMFIEERGNLPEGELLIIDDGRNAFTVKFVKDVKAVLAPDAEYYFSRTEDKPGYKCTEVKLIF